MLKTLAFGCAWLLLAGARVEGGDEPAAARQAYTKAWEDYRGGRGAEARGALETLIGDYPTYRDPYLLLAILVYEAGEPRLAARVYQDLLKERPADVDARLWRAGILLYDVRDFAGAAVEYESARDHPAADERQRLDARSGLERVVEFRVKRTRLRDERSRLHRILFISLALWLGIFVAAWFLTRPCRHKE